MTIAGVANLALAAVNAFIASMAQSLLCVFLFPVVAPSLLCFLMQNFGCTGCLHDNHGIKHMTIAGAPAANGMATGLLLCCRPNHS